MTPLILADDFAGACDSAARAAAAGYSASAILTPPPASLDADLLAVSTETRHSSPAAARAAIRSLEALLRGRALYKKIDSTLRGPWIDEVDELLLCTDYSQALVCPAFPDQGRTVLHGWLYVGGQPARRIDCPFTVRDASTEDDLARIAADLCSSILPVGSAGLAFHFFRRDRPSATPQTPALRPQPGPWLVLIGSSHPSSRAQLQFLRDARLPNVLINPDSYPSSLSGAFATGGETAARFLRAAGASGIALLRELLPGVPAGLILGGRYNGAVMITKAGGFGAPDAILRALEFVL
ncbi:MAG: hypothetical protein HY236_04760 [Acidobacteria bacterium]|nr:hypothetical protein [Acidobacteriota bacterium]